MTVIRLGRAALNHNNDAEIAGTEGCTWTEHFTFADAEAIAAVMDRVADTHVPTPNRAAWTRFTNILYALTNDSDVCIVTAGDQPGVHK